MEIVKNCPFASLRRCGKKEKCSHIEQYAALFIFYRALS